MKGESQQTLVILSPGFPADESDSTCIPPQQVFVASLKKLNPALEIVVIAFQYPYKTQPYAWKGVQVIPLNGRNKGKLHRLFTWTRAWRILKKLNKQKNILGLLSFWCGETAVVTSRFARRHHLRHFSWILGQDALPINKLVNLIRPKEGELIALSDFLQRQFHAHHGIKPAYVIPCAIDAQQFPLEKKHRGIDILGVGSLIPLKKYDVFIEMIQHIKIKFPSVNAVICGKGPQQEKLWQMIMQFGLAENILLAGEKPHEEILTLMQQAKILLHPSSYEGFGAVCLEALYAGAHVVSFVQPMNTRIEHWHIVKTKEELQDKLMNLLGSPISHEAILPFSINRTTREMMQLFGYEETMT
jgi:glycosyltransferase involved in cell wall biosynthesis